MRMQSLMWSALLWATTSVAATAQQDAVPAAVVQSLGAPSRLESRFGALDFKDGAPSAATADAVYTALAVTNGLNVYNNSFRGASAYAIRQGFLSIGAEDNTVVIFSELMDATGIFLTGNADTIYYLAVLDLTKGPIVVEQPPEGLGTINDMWFSWIVDIGFPGPDRGEGGKYLIVPPGYDGPLPEGGFFIARSSTLRALYAARAFLTNNDPKPTVEMIKSHIKIYPYTPGAFGTLIRSMSCVICSAGSRSIWTTIGPCTPRTPAAYAHASSAVASENPMIGFGSRRSASTSSRGRMRMRP